MSDPTAPASSALPPIGLLIKDRYRVLRLLGEGGMGGVYEAEHVEVGKRVAVKLVSAVHAQSEQIAARLKREARSTGALESDHIVQVFDAGEDPQAGLFLVMELLRGRDLGVLLDGGKRIGVEATAHVAYQAAMGLEKAHDGGIVHRDLKPANMFLCERDDGSVTVKLVDFGIAKLVRDANVTGGANLTREGSVIGTPQYMSPEQAQGLDTLDLRTDVYSLGAVMYEMITGTTPHPNLPTYEQIILHIVMHDAPLLSAALPSAHIPPALDSLVASMLARDPATRPQSMRAVRSALTAMFPDLGRRRLALTDLENNPIKSLPPGFAPTQLGAPAVTPAPQSRTSVVENWRAPPPPPPQTSSGVSVERSREPSRGPAVALLAGVAGLLLFVAIGGGALWYSRSARKDGAALTGVTSVSPMPAVDPSVASTPTQSKTSAPALDPKPVGSIAPAASVAPVASPLPSLQTSGGRPIASAAVGAQRPTGSSGTRPPGASSNAATPVHQVGGAGATDQF